MWMSIAPFAYELPQDRIAFHPPAERGGSRLLCVSRTTGEITDRKYADLAELLRPDDLVIINNTRVIKARLLATTASGQQRELFLSEKHATPLLALTARVIYRGKLRVGDILTIGDENIEVLRVFDGNEGGQALIRATIPPQVIAERYGHVPLPPYIKRDDEPADSERYQAVFARKDGSVAAPTASLNLTDDLLGKMKAKGIKVESLTLHVGRGTFLPIRTDEVSEHIMHEEYYSIPQRTVRAIRRAKAEGRRVVAIGTTVTRALEHAREALLDEPSVDRDKDRHGLRSSSDRIRGEADIFITPGYEFEIVNVLLTNFHAPDSTVLQLAAAFAGVDYLEGAYRHALAGDYQFLSYGDSMLID